MNDDRIAAMATPVLPAIATVRRMSEPGIVPIGAALWTTGVDTQQASFLYEAMTGRTSEMTGADYWSRQNHRDVAVFDLAASFLPDRQPGNDVQSPDTVSLIDHLFRHTLGRPATQAEHDQIIYRINSGTLTASGLIIFVMQLPDAYAHLFTQR